MHGQILQPIVIRERMFTGQMLQPLVIRERMFTVKYYSKLLFVNVCLRVKYYSKLLLVNVCLRVTVERRRDVPAGTARLHCAVECEVSAATGGPVKTN